MSERYVEYCPVCGEFVSTKYIDDELICCQCGAELGVDEPSIEKDWYD